MTAFRRALAAGLVLAMILSACGGRRTGRYYEKNGGFSYDPPAGWRIAPFPGIKYRVAHGPRENEFAPNINIVDKPFAGPLDAYVDLAIEALHRGYPAVKIVKRAPFRTTDGLDAIRLITENEQYGQRLRQTYGFFGRSDRKYVATCTALAEGGEEMDPVFAESMKTFRIH